MGSIAVQIQITGLRKTKSLLALFDSGALQNHMRRSFQDGDTTDDVGFHLFEGGQFSVLADGSQVPTERVRFRELRIGSASVKEPDFMVMEDLSWDVIIGAAQMQKLGIKLDFSNDSVILSDATEIKTDWGSELS